jgi:lysophospholipase L1-like esterase
MAVLTVVVAVVVIEGAARVAFTLYEDFGGVGAWYVRSTEVGWIPRPGFSGTIYEEMRSFDAQGFLAVDTEQIGSKSQGKVIVLGDSTSFGYGVDVGDTFAERLDAMLTGQDVVNLSLPGYTSYQGYQVLQSWIDQLAPEVVIVAFNFNDRRYVVGDSDADGPARFEFVGRPDWESRFEVFHTFRAVRFGLKSVGLVRRSGGGRDFNVEELRPRVALSDYEANLTKIVELVRDRGATAVFLLLKDNPVDSYRLRQGIALIDAGSPEDAVAPLQLAVEFDNSFSILARRYLAEAYSRTDAEASAAETTAFHATFPISVHGGEPIRLDTEYNDAMLRVADRLGVEVVDPRAVLDADPTVYQDACHITAHGHVQVAELLHRTLSRIASGQDLSEP